MRGKGVGQDFSSLFFALKFVREATRKYKAKYKAKVKGDTVFKCEYDLRILFV